MPQRNNFVRYCKRKLTEEDNQDQVKKRKMLWIHMGLKVANQFTYSQPD